MKKQPKKQPDESPLDQAKQCVRLKRTGLTLQQIAEAVGEDYLTVRNRLQILRLPQEDQDKIHEGKLSWTRAIKKLAQGGEQVSAENTDGP